MTDITHYDPPGVAFYDLASDRQMKLITEGPYRRWLVFKHPDGQWVSLREATPKDYAQVAPAAIQAGSLVRCTKEAYAEVRRALQHNAGKWVDEGLGMYAQIALNEVKRLDDLYATLAT
jgi:hypothetical protein